MINKLIELSEDLASYGIKYSESWHQNLPRTPQPSKGGVYKVILNKNGSLRTVESFANESWLDLRYFSPNKHQQFPSFKVAQMLRPEIFDRIWREGKCSSDSLSIIQNHIDEHPFKKFQRCIRVASKDLLKQVDTSAPAFKSLIDLVEAIDKADSKVLYSEIVDAIVRLNNRESLVSCYLAMDVYQPKFDADYVPVQNISLFKEANKCFFLNQKKERENNQSDGKDVFGANISGYKEPFYLRISHVGELTIFSKNENTPSNERYGLIGNESFPIGSYTRENLSSALQFLTDESRYGKTFKRLGESGGKAIIAFNYWDGIRQFETATPLFFDSEEKKNDNLIADFEKESEAILEVFTKIVQKITDAKFKIFCVKVPGNGVPYVSFSKTEMVSGLIISTKKWINGCKNFPVQNGIKFVIPSPFDFWKAINKKIGMGKNSQCGETYFEFLSINDVYEFFLQSDFSLGQITRILANNHAKMLIRSKDGKMNNGWCLRYIMPMVGLVLTRNNKENYMNELPYLLGQLCAVSNGLQKLYFESRSPSKGEKGRIPNKLIGSEHIQWFMDNPKRALASLSRRIIHYRDWAQSNIERVDYASYYVSKLKDLNEKIERQLGQLDSFKRNDLATISIAMGYSAGLTKLEKNLKEKEENSENLK